ncbi:MAG: EboA domain-containing protein [Planctomycetota bacterium]
MPTPIRDLLAAASLGPAAALAETLAAECTADPGRLPVAFPGIPRKTSRDPIGGGHRNIATGNIATGDGATGVGATGVGATGGGATGGGAIARVDLDCLRVCDLVATSILLASQPSDAALIDLWSHGDIEERTMLLRALNFLPLGPTTAGLFGEVLRSNVVLHLEAAICDTDLLVRAAEAKAIDRDLQNRLLLKFAFVDLPLERALGAERCASAELSTMLQDLATEREAAGRSVWRDTWRMLGCAPCPGALARLIGGLEHGDDGVRRAAADGLLKLPERGAGVAGFAKERLPREPRADIRTLLQQLSQ